VKTVWRLIDQKPGHENQSAGLCNALGRINSITCFDITVKGRWQHFYELITGHFALGEALPAPDLIIGAGHATHFALLAARRRFGGRSVVLMRPSLPAKWFDLCVVPEHDRVTGQNIFTTQGVINTVLPVKGGKGSQVLMLIGGESKHRCWDDAIVVKQIAAISNSMPETPIVLTNSRRTPGSFLDQLSMLKIRNVDIVPWQQTGVGWMNDQLSKSATVWVTPDSVSMVYEAITSASNVGLFDLPVAGDGRVNQGVQSLIEQHWVSPFSEWQSQGVLHKAPGRFCEADRCAEWLMSQLTHG